MAPWLGQQQHWRPSVPILNTYASLRWHGSLLTWCGCRELGRIGAPDYLTKLSCLSGVPPLQSLPSNTKTRLQTCVLSSLSILLVWMAHGDAWVDGTLSHYCQTTTSKVGQQSSVGIANSYRLDDLQIESRWGLRISTPIQTGPRSDTTSSTIDTRSLSRWQNGQGVDLTNHPL